ncbi:hypothetical protein ACHAXR_003277 [Thalassiosira sp. AJA248-18]
MSVSLIGRQLNALKLAAPWLISTKASPIAASHITATTPRVDIARNNDFLRSPLQIIDMARTLSTMGGATSKVNEQTSANDDGGPVAGSFTFKEMSNKELADMSTIPGWNLVHNPPRRNPRGALVGKVVSDKMQKTVNVAVDRFKMIPKYRKRWRFTRKFMAHDEHEVCNVGDLVMIVPSQKISKHKHFMVREIIRPKGQL